MAGVKYEEKYWFPDGHIWVLMDDEWGVEIIGEEGFDGALVTVQSWDFSTHESWIKWGEFCMDQLAKLEEKAKHAKPGQDIELDELYEIDEKMEDDLKKYVIC